jgi:pantothenate kinase
MDGYHYTKEQLKLFPDPELAFKRRGSFWTFDGRKFLQDIQLLRRNRCGLFPSFDHAIGDPIKDDITVDTSDKVVLVEGNYLLIEEVPWIDLKHNFDLTIYLDVDQETLEQRVVGRHMKVGLSQDEAAERYVTNDKENAREIELCKCRADLVVTIV